MLSFIINFILLFATWVVLSGFFNVFFITLGALSCLCAAMIARKINKDEEKPENILPVFIRLPIYFAWLVKEIIISSFTTTVKVWQLSPNITPTIGWVNTALCDDLGLTVFANSITLTPGTVAVSVREGIIQVHALEKSGILSLKEGTMSKKVFSAVHGRSEK